MLTEDEVWKKVEENIGKIGLEMKDATDCRRWYEGVKRIVHDTRCNRHLHLLGINRIKTGLMKMMMMLRQSTGCLSLKRNKLPMQKVT